MTTTDAQPDRFDLKSLDVADTRRAELLRLFPEARTEGGMVDFDRLRAALGEMIDSGRERYVMTWPGKGDTFQTIQAPSLATLLPCPEESVNFDATENLIIEGDNLEVLKLLQKSYLGKVKMIYIDPPYNTGKDFIYPDNYAESLQTYLEYTGQVDDEGRKFGTNPETDGRFHSKWLSMMYPRLYLARNLLSEDGVIFISIDDCEVENLRRLCDEIFGEENFVASVIWEKTYSPRMDVQDFSTAHDYVIVVRRSSQGLVGKETFEQNIRQFTYIDEATGRKYRRRTVRKEGSNSLRADAPGSWFPLTAPDGTDVWPYKPLKKGESTRTEGVWRWSLSTYEERLKSRDVEWVETADEGWQPYAKQFLEGEAEKPPITIWHHSEVGHTHSAADEVAALLGPRVFDTPKPIGLIQKMLAVTTSPDQEHVVLDFFAGSGSTAHAVLDLNKQDGGDRKFILVQLPEPTEREDYPTIAEITKERVRRAISKLEAEQAGKLDLDGIRSDLGFRVFKLAESNFTPWDADAPSDAAALNTQIGMHVEHVRDERTDLDLLYEVILKAGLALTVAVETLTLAGKTVYRVPGIDGPVLVCLERGLTLDLMRAIAKEAPRQVVLLDEGFAGNDQLKANAVQIFKTRGGVKFETI